jgi:hypothetical protein
VDEDSGLHFGPGGAQNAPVHPSGLRPAAGRTGDQVEPRVVRSTSGRRPFEITCSTRTPDQCLGRIASPLCKRDPPPRCRS